MHNKTPRKNGLFSRIWAFLRGTPRLTPAGKAYYEKIKAVPRTATVANANSFTAYHPDGRTVDNGVGFQAELGQAAQTEDGLNIPIESDGWLYAGANCECLRISGIILDGRNIPPEDTFAVNLEDRRVRCYVRNPKTKRIILDSNDRPLVNEYHGDNLQVNWHPMPPLPPGHTPLSKRSAEIMSEAFKETHNDHIGLVTKPKSIGPNV